MTPGTSATRTFSTAAAIAIVLFASWSSWREFQGRRREAEGQRRLRIADSAEIRWPVPIDSFCRRGPGDGLVHRDGIAWIAARTGLPLRGRGRDDGWDWGCLQTPDSGIVLFVALDSGCATYSAGGLWSHSCRLESQAWDLVFRRGSSPRYSYTGRSLWTFPGQSRVCPPTPRPDPPRDSLVQERCGPAPRKL